MEHTNRRPVLPQLKVSTKFPKGFQLELPFPSDLDTVNEILFAFLDQHRKPSHSLFVLDVSGSMEGGRIEDLKKALLNLTGDDSSLTGRFARFRNRERVTLITFDSTVIDNKTFEMSDDRTSLTEMRQMIGGLRTHGSTAIYGALDTAYGVAERSMANDPKRFYSIVLMTDGANTTGMDFNRFAQQYRKHAASYEGIKIFPILFGDSNDGEMKELAAITGGRVFDSRKDSLAQAFKHIRGYQ